MPDMDFQVSVCEIMPSGTTASSVLLAYNVMGRAIVNSSLGGRQLRRAKSTVMSSQCFSSSCGASTKEAAYALC